jgi:hypothetical protein
MKYVFKFFGWFYYGFICHNNNEWYLINTHMPPGVTYYRASDLFKETYTFKHIQKDKVKVNI